MNGQTQQINDDHNQYYKGWVGCDIYVTQNYFLPTNLRRQSTGPIRDFKGGPPVGTLQAQCYMSFELSFGMQRS
jgi:hypothetical protein